MNKQASVISNLPALQKVNEVGIPTKKLNTIQLKNYREYADKVYESVSKMLKEIKKEVLKRFEEENEEKIRKEIVNELGVEKYANELNAIVKRAKDINAEALKLASDYDSKIQKLQLEKESKATTLKSEKMYPLIDEYNDLRAKVMDEKNKNSNISCPLSGDLRVTTAKEYSYDDYEIDDYGNYTKNKRELILEYPALTITGISSLKAYNFVDSSAVTNKLGEKMAPAVAEFELAEVKLETMGQAVREVMMFDEERMNEAFEKLFQFRDDIQQKHLQIVRKINLNEGV
ncbi:hypothetical protein [Immundisolibacter sp.]